MSSDGNLLSFMAIGGLAVVGGVFVSNLIAKREEELVRRDRRRRSKPLPTPSPQTQDLTTAIMQREAPARSMGFSMEEAREHAEKEKASVRQMGPSEVLAELQKGNTRFFMGVASRPEMSAFERRALISQQFPNVAILGCSDSRVPVEIVFDQGLGDLFVVRVAGNALGLSTLASLEYSVKHLEVKVVVVMGHEGCGAIKAAAQPLEAIMGEPESLRNVLKELKSGLDEASYAPIKDGRARDREMVTNNVRVQIDTLRKDESLRAKVQSGELILAGAFYEISSGIVDFFYTVDADNI